MHKQMWTRMHQYATIMRWKNSDAMPAYGSCIYNTSQHSVRWDWTKEYNVRANNHQRSEHATVD